MYVYESGRYGKSFGIYQFVAALAYLAYGRYFSLLYSYVSLDWSLAVSTIDYAIGYNCVELFPGGAACYEAATQKRCGTGKRSCTDRGFEEPSS